MVIEVRKKINKRCILEANKKASSLPSLFKDLENSGTKTTLRAPSAKMFLSIFARRKAVINASLIGEAPSLAAIIISLIKPNTLLRRVPELTAKAERRSFIILFE
jgi:hypothetical protein